MGVVMPLEITQDRGSLKQQLQSRTAPAAEELIDRLDDGAIRCHACGHRCLVKRGRDGVCRVRFNDSGALRVPFGYVGALACDPIEKKPFFHVLPGSDALTFGMLGCDFHCGYCQNWVTSQMLRDPNAIAPPRDCTPEQLADLAVEHRARVVASSYNEPLITTEWAMAVFRASRERGLLCAYVSNGNATERVLDYIRPLVPAYKVDLKTFSDRNYRRLGGVLENVTRTIRMLRQRDFWVEIVTLLVPGFSDDPDDLRRMTDFLVEVDPLMPWHVTAFHPDYQFVVEIGVRAGLKYIYPGNIPGGVGEWENTRCHACGQTVIERCGFRVRSIGLNERGQCPGCGATIPGIWGCRSGLGDGRIKRVAI
jgi:pyruvate formate lyase activating enzyme